MKQLKLNNRDYVFVPVPEDAEEFGTVYSTIFWWDAMGKMDWRHLPSFTEHLYKFVTTTDALTEEQAEFFIQTQTGMGCAWCIAHADTIGLYGYATDSFQSLLKHHSLTGRYAIIEKI